MIKEYIRFNDKYNDTTTKVSDHPPIYLIDDFITIEQCNSLIDQTSHSLVPSPVVGSSNGVESIARTSQTCFLCHKDVPTLIKNVSTLLYDKPYPHIELPQICKYATNQRYDAHYDAFDVTDADGRRHMFNGGQRLCTVLIYLNTVTSGGKTSFPRIDREFTPKAGRAVVFFPCTITGELDDLALHAALPAVDEKYVCQIWVRESEYDGVHNISLQSKV